MRCSVVFGVTLRLLVINILSSSPAINTAAYERCVTTCVSVAVVDRRPCWQHPVLLQRQHQAVKPDVGSESRFLPTPPAFDAPVRGFPSEYCHVVWCGKKLEWLGYPTVKIFRRCLYSFWQNVRTWHTQTHGHTAWWHRPRLQSMHGKKCCLFSAEVIQVSKQTNLKTRSTMSAY